MPTRDSYAEGTPNWVDLSTSDPDAAMDFYAELFDWDFQRQPTDDDGEYIMAMIEGYKVAGLMQQAPQQASAGVPPLWNVYLATDDVEATVAKVAGAGGQVMMPPMPVMDSGHMAVVVDPTGAVVGLWQANEHIGAELVNETGAVMWNELVTDDFDGAFAFYERVLGLEELAQDMGEDEPYRMFTVAEDPVAGTLPLPMEGVPNHWNVYFAVDDTDEIAEAVPELGGDVIAAPFDIAVGRIAGFTDPQGATFFVLQPSEDE